MVIAEPVNKVLTFERYKIRPFALPLVAILLHQPSSLEYRSTASPLDRYKARQPVTYQELGVDRLGTAKATLYGMCVHDHAMAPCQKQRECMTCKEHVCIKGVHVTLERLLVLEAQIEHLLEKAQQAHRDGDFGADRWVDNHKWRLAHVRSIRMALQSPRIPDGVFLIIPEGHDPSAVRRALMDLGMEDQPETGFPRISITPLALD